MICRVGNLFLLGGQVDGRVHLAVHEDLIDVDLHLPDALAPHPSPIGQVFDALRHAGGVRAGAERDLVLPYPAPAILVGIAAQGCQDADVKSFQALII